MSLIIAILIFSGFALTMREAVIIVQRNLAVLFFIIIKKHNKWTLLHRLFFTFFKKTYFFLRLLFSIYFGTFIIHVMQGKWLLHDLFLTIIRRTKPAVTIRKFPSPNTVCTPSFRVIFIHGALNYYEDFAPRWGQIENIILNNFNGNVEFYAATWQAKNNEEIRRADSKELFFKIVDINKNNNIPTVFIGHSHGGSIASHTAKLLKNSGFESYSISIGTPFVVLSDVAKTGFNNAASVLFGAFSVRILVYFGIFNLAKYFLGEDKYFFQILKIPDSEFFHNQPFFENFIYYIIIGFFAVFMHSRLLSSARKVYDLNTLEVQKDAHCDSNFSQHIVVANDEVFKLSQISLLSLELEQLQRKLARYHSLFMFSFAKTSETVLMPILIPIIFTALLVLVMGFFDINYKIPGHSKFFSSAIWVILFTVFLTIGTNFWRSIRDKSIMGNSFYFVFSLPQIFDFVRQIFLSRIAGLHPWPLSLFLKPQIMLTSANNEANLDIIPKMRRPAHVNILSDEQTACYINRKLRKWFAV